MGPDDFVLEVGTGAGTLTAELAARAARVATVELEADLQEIAREVIADSPAGEAGLARVRFIAGDALEGERGLHPEVEAALADAHAAGLCLKCVSNFPYSIATPLFVTLLERAVVERAWPLAIVAGMVQREVAERLTAKEIGKEYGVPSVLVQSLAKVAVDRRVSPRAFWPPPRVESAVIRIVPAERPAVADYARFRDVVRAVFQYRRKTIKNALQLGLGLPPERTEAALRGAGIEPDARVEALSVERLERLASEVGTP